MPEFGKAALSLITDIPKRPTLIAAIGDSRFNNSISFPTNGVAWSNRGILSWFNFLSKQKFLIPLGYNKAISGYTTTQILGLVPSVLALNPKPRYCLVLGGTNDNPMDLTILQNNFKSIVTQLLAGGVTPIFLIDLPRSTSAWTANNKKVHISFNHWLRTWCLSNGFILVDPYRDISNQSDGEPVTGTTVDGIHHSCNGGYLIGKKIADTLAALFPTPTSDTGVASVIDVYDATYNSYGNLLGTQGLMLGTTGTNYDANSSGTVATGWINRVISGTGTSVASKENPRADGGMGDAQVLALSATTLMTTRFYQSAYSVGWSIGDKVYAEADIEIVNGANKLDYFHMNLFGFNLGGGTTTYQSLAFKGDTTSAYPMPSTGVSGRMRTMPFTIPTNTTELRVWFEGQIEAGGSATVKVSNVSIRKVYADDGIVI